MLLSAPPPPEHALQDKAPRRDTAPREASVPRHVTRVTMICRNKMPSRQRPFDIALARGAPRYGVTPARRYYGRYSGHAVISIYDAADTRYYATYRRGVEPRAALYGRVADTRARQRHTMPVLF